MLRIDVGVDDTQCHRNQSNNRQNRQNEDYKLTEESSFSPFHFTCCF